MVHYLGSKKHHAVDILKHVLAERRTGQWYVEPFVGGGNVLTRVPAEQGPRMANDYNKYMVALLNALGNDNFLPPVYLERKHREAIEASPDVAVPWVCNELNVHPVHWLALVGHTAGSITFGSMWWNTYMGENDIGRTKQRQAYDACVRDAPLLKGVEFHTGSYDDLVIPPDSIVYCDPPYADTAGYLSDGAFIDGDEYRWRSDTFWKWANARVDDGHQLFVSEYRGPGPGAYPTVRTADHRHALDVLNALPKAMTVAERAAWMNLPGNRYKRPPEGDAHAAERANLSEAIQEFDRADLTRRLELAAAWRPVWSKDVNVNVNAIDLTAEGQQNKRVELLLTRSL